MLYALVHYPAINKERINLLRSKYDPQFSLIEPHVTIVFPLTDSIGEHRLNAHVEGVLHNWKAFPVHLNGLKRSWDNHLFLLLQEGNAEVRRLHEEMYTGILASHHKSELPFIPHITLGMFDEDAQRYVEARNEAERLNLDYRCLLECLHLVKVNDELTHIVWSKEFWL